MILNIGMILFILLACLNLLICLIYDITKYDMYSLIFLICGFAYFFIAYLKIHGIEIDRD